MAKQAGTSQPTAQRARRLSPTFGPPILSRLGATPALYLVVGGGFLLFAFGLRLYRLDFQSLWYDEGWSVYLAGRPVWESLPLIAGSGHTHPPGYYLLLSAWSALAGTSEFAVRFLSAALGVLLVAAGGRLLRGLLDRTAGLAGLSALALAPVLVVYAQETRMYTLLALEYVVLLAVFHRLAAAPEPGWRPWAVLALAEAAAAYTHYFAAILIAYLSVAYGLVVLARWRRTRLTFAAGPVRDMLPWLVVQAAVAVAYVPWLAVALRQTGEHVPRDVAPPALSTFLIDTWNFFNSGVLGATGESAWFAGLSTAAGVLGVIAVGLAARNGPNPNPPPFANSGEQGREQEAREGLPSPMRDRSAGEGPGMAAGPPSPAGGFPAGGGPGMGTIHLLALVAHGLIPLVAVYFVSQLRPGVHPRYVVMLAVPLFLAVAAAVRILLARPPVLALAGGVAAGVFAAAWLIGLQISALDPNTFRDDVRALAGHIARESTAADLVVFDYEDWAYHHYDRGPAATAYLPLSGDDAADAARLASAAAGRRDVFLVDWRQGRTDFRSLLPFLLETAGRLVDREDLPGLSVRRYRMDEPGRITDVAARIANGGAQAAPAPWMANFGSIKLMGMTIPEVATAGEAIPVGLRWQLVTPVSQHLKTAVILHDAAGRELSRADTFLLDAAGRDTAHWAAGAVVTVYALLPVSPGTPPLSYTVETGVYDETAVAGLDLRDVAGNPAGKRLSLGQVHVGVPAVRGTTSDEANPDPYQSAPRLPALGDVRLADGLVLEAGGVDRTRAQPGESLDVTLRWRAERRGLPDLAPELRLVQAGRVLAEDSQAPAEGQYPTSRWQAGEVVLDRRRLAVPAGAQPGEAELSVAVGGSPWLTLARVKLAVSEHSFSEPPAAFRFDRSFPEIADLVGYDLHAEPAEACRLEPEVGAGTVTAPATPAATVPGSKVEPTTANLHIDDAGRCSVKLTLYWRSTVRDGREGGAGRPLTVFAHLLDAQGRLIGQHDGPPAEGRRPTTGWVDGEFVADVHPVRFQPELTPDQLRAAAASGPAIIEIGWYDAATGTRVPAAGGADHVVLPSEIILVMNGVKR